VFQILNAASAGERRRAACSAAERRVALMWPQGCSGVLQANAVFKEAIGLSVIFA